MFIIYVACATRFCEYLIGFWLLQTDNIKVYILEIESYWLMEEVFIGKCLL